MLANLTPPFRFTHLAAISLLGLLKKNRNAAASAIKHNRFFGWRRAAEALDQGELHLRHYLGPCEPALLRSANGGIKVHEVHAATAFHVVAKLAGNTREAMEWFNLRTNRGKKPLVIRGNERKVFEDAGYFKSVTAFTDDEVNELKARMEIEISKAESVANADVESLPEVVARKCFGDRKGLMDYWKEIGYSPNSDNCWPPPSTTDDRGQASLKSRTWDAAAAPPSDYPAGPMTGTKQQRDPHDNDQIGKKKLPLNGDVRDLCLYLKAKLSDFGSMTACARDFCGTHRIDRSRAEGLLRQAKRFPHLWKS